MPSDRKICTRCGAMMDPSLRFCTGCGAPLIAGPPPPPPGAHAPDPGPPLPTKRTVATAPPSTLPALLRVIATRMRQNIRSAIRGMIKAVIIGFVLVLVLNTLLLTTDLGRNPVAASLIDGGSLASSEILLFWLLFSALAAFFWTEVRSRGARNALGRCAAIPRWIFVSVKSAGESAFPLLMTGIAAALLIRLFLLTTATAVTFLILMFGILYSRQESLWLLAMSLGYSDIHRLFLRSGPVIPAPGYAVTLVSGSFCGFAFVLFYAENLLIIATGVLIAAAVIVLLQYRKKRAGPAAAAVPGQAG